MSRTAERKDHPLSMRLPDADIAIIDRAATLRGRSRTDFVRDAAVRAAEDDDAGNVGAGSGGAEAARLRANVGAGGRLRQSALIEGQVRHGRPVALIGASLAALRLTNCLEGRPLPRAHTLSR